MPGVPLFNARVQDLVHADAIEAECLECGHKSHVAGGKIKAKVPDWYRVLDLPRVLRCGRSIVTARQALGYDKIKE